MTARTKLTKRDPEPEVEAELVPDADDVEEGVLVRLEDVPPPALPEPSKWAQLTHMADYLCQSQLVPRAIRTSKTASADTALVLLAAHDLGITVTEALSKIHVVEGRLTMSAELMVALIRRAGHQVWPDDANDATQARAYGRRRDEQEVASAGFTIEDAKRAGLAGKDNWKRYPEDMLWARAVSRLARRHFPDVVGGVSYTPEELGEVTDAEVLEDADTVLRVSGKVYDSRDLGFDTAQEWHDAVDALRAETDDLDPSERERFVAWKQARHFTWPWDQAAIEEMTVATRTVVVDDDQPELEPAEVAEDVPDVAWASSRFGADAWADAGIFDVERALAYERDGETPESLREPF